QGIDIVEFTGLEEGGDHRPTFSTAVVAGKECVLAGQSQAPDRALDRVRVDLDTTVIEEPAEAVPVVEAIAERLGEFASLRHFGEARFEPRASSPRRWVSSAADGSCAASRATDHGSRPRCRRAA